MDILVEMNNLCSTRLVAGNQCTLWCVAGPVRLGVALRRAAKELKGLACKTVMRSKEWGAAVDLKVERNWNA